MNASVYTVELKRSAEKELFRLPEKDQKVVGEAIGGLAANPRKGAKKLKGVDLWRIRAGEYRVIFAIEDKRLVVLVVRIGHRKEVYRHIG